MNEVLSQAERQMGELQVPPKYPKLIGLCNFDRPKPEIDPAILQSRFLVPLSVITSLHSDTFIQSVFHGVTFTFQLHPDYSHFQ